MEDHCIKPQLIYRSTVKSLFGLTAAMIRDIGEPDKIVPNPHRRSTKAYLYDVARVEEWVDGHREWLEREQKKREKRSTIALRVAQERRQKTIEWATNVEIMVAPLPSHLRKLREETLQWGEWRRMDRRLSGDMFIAGPNAVSAHVRHMYTDYDLIWPALHNMVGRLEAYWIVRGRVDEIVEHLLCDQYGPDWAEKVESMVK